ncbi:hypothetical protein A8H40_04575 [Burkholderia multivorans]|uniref:2-hydroxyacyl-CoA dehydratase n=1 Tax=Burkholderia multivorans TaxID=87883 RepID=A0A8E2RWZ3_9BURK|nr:hypothetical protein A8H40_04575 [Burkholderia multivorans]EJO62484.1 hypothetical protein BURMUCF1_A0330 [Burkholderia multivorans ATCC BAA-247]PRD85883.1 hypothetical protein C6P76_15955 [Burkholderia multivorans]PRE27052.1 hypothetical protein C6P79_16165 [Burkholderia multivorans]PRF24949.1 hypothetical protein C6P98_10500 [Burkholderia multivorans]
MAGARGKGKSHRRCDAADAEGMPPRRFRNACDRATARALEEAGVPTVIVDADMVDARHRDRESSPAQIDAFLRDRVCL